MKLAIVDKEGKDTGKKAELKDSIFRIEPNDHAVYMDVKQEVKLEEVLPR